MLWVEVLIQYLGAANSWTGKKMLTFNPSKAELLFIQKLAGSFSAALVSFDGITLPLKKQVYALEVALDLQLLLDSLMEVLCQLCSFLEEEALTIVTYATS